MRETLRGLEENMAGLCEDEGLYAVRERLACVAVNECVRQRDGRVRAERGTRASQVVEVHSQRADLGGERALTVGDKVKSACRGEGQTFFGDRGEKRGRTKTSGQDLTAGRACRGTWRGGAGGRVVGETKATTVVAHRINSHRRQPRR